MKVLVILYATLAHLLPRDSQGNTCVMDVSEGTTVSDVLNSLKVPGDAVKVIFLNGRHANEDQPLQEGDRLAVFPPVAGG